MAGYGLSSSCLRLADGQGSGLVCVVLGSEYGAPIILCWSFGALDGALL
jgi:hypothetical protein